MVIFKGDMLRYIEFENSRQTDLDRAQGGPVGPAAAAQPRHPHRGERPHQPLLPPRASRPLQPRSQIHAVPGKMRNTF